jgi:hypothetical protein
MVTNFKLHALQLEERTATVAMGMLKGAASPSGVKLVLPAQLSSPISTPGIMGVRMSYTGSGGF